MLTPKISVIIPSFNKSRFIEKTLQSIFNQNYGNIEVIVQDGGSTDGTVEIIKKYSKKYSIIWESKKDKGQLDAINKGIKKASGDIVCFINADDVYFKDSFSIVAKAYKENPKALWFAGRGMIINDKDIEIAKPVTIYKNFLLSNATYHLLLTTNFLIQPSIFLTREAYQKFGPFTGTRDFVMEYDLWLRLGKISMPIVINKYLSKFRIELGTKTKIMTEKILNEDWKIVKKYTQNPILLLLYKFNNFGRRIINKFV